MRDHRLGKKNGVWGQTRHKKQFKWEGEPNSPWLGSTINRFVILSKVVENISIYNLDNRNILREVTVKIGLEIINI